MSIRRTIEKEVRSELYRWVRWDPARRSPVAFLSLLMDTPVDVIRCMQLKKSLTALEAITDMLEARDHYTVDHSRRVAELCVRVCLLLHLPRFKSAIIVSSAAVHDIGKVGVHDAVLHKMDRLDEMEFEEIRRHPVIGADILQKSSKLYALADGVRHHHERWDGGGYPDGLRGMDIPLSSRIIAVCDSIDAMRSDRPYRQVLSDRRCRGEIEQGVGSIYDPDIALLCLKHWNFLTEGFYVDSLKNDCT